MENETSGSGLTDFVKKCANLISTSEKVSLTILTIGLILYFNKVQNTGFVLIAGSGLTAITYFLFAFKPVDVDNEGATGIISSLGFINFTYKLTHLAMSIAAAGFSGLVIKSFPLDTIISVSGITLILVLALSLAAKFNDRNKVYNSVYYLRVVISILAVAWLANIRYKFF